MMSSSGVGDNGNMGSSYVQLLVVRLEFYL
jgi:hypothetical protein